MSINKTLSDKIRGISFLCSMLVILLHAYDVNLWNASGQYAHYVVTIISYGVCGIAVPYFFIVSGWLFTHQYDSGISYGNLMKKRLKTLGIPYIYWCLIYTFTLVLFTIYGNKLAGRPLTKETSLVVPLYSWKNPFRILGLNLFYYPANATLWYVRNLLLLMLFSPILMKIIKNKTTGIIFIVFLTILDLVSYKISSELWHNFFNTGFTIKGLLFYSIGIYLQKFPFVWKPRITIALLFFFVWMIHVCIWRLSSNFPFIILHTSFFIGCIAIWSIYDYLPWHKRLESWHGTHYSFFIYVSHFALMRILFCQKACILLKRYIIDSNLLVFVVRFIFSGFMAIVLAYVLERYLPKVYRALTGGR